MGQGVGYALSEEAAVDLRDYDGMEYAKITFDLG